MSEHAKHLVNISLEITCCSLTANVEGTTKGIHVAIAMAMSKNEQLKNLFKKGIELAEKQKDIISQN